MPNFSLSSSVPKAATAVDIPVFRDQLDGLPSPLKKVAGLQNFSGKTGQTLVTTGDGNRVQVLVGLGAESDFDTESLRLAAAAYGRSVSTHEAVATNLFGMAEGLDTEAALSAVVEGIGLVSYRFSSFKSSPVKLKRVSIVGGGKGLRASLTKASAVMAAVDLARDLVNEPGGSLLPEDFAAKARSVAAESGLKINVWSRSRIARERLGGVLAVTKGSTNAPQFVKLTYTPSRPKGHIALVGKGVTFDSGGLSLKTGTGMMLMKIDMAGAASVLAAMSALPALKVPVAVTGYIPLVENMPSGDAVRPGDVFAARNGKTVEVLNTDAEGRLILADALSLAAESDADAIIDMATLTGSATAALGADYAALMATDDAVADALLAGAAEAGERMWRMPLPPEYRSQLDSSVADLRNIGTSPYGGALTAGLFLKEFTGDKPWAHIDVGLSVFSDANKGWKVKGATGYGVRTLIRTLQAWE